LRLPLRLPHSPPSSLLLGALLLAACNSTNPVEPTGQKPPTGTGGAYTITITSSLDILPVGSTTPATITVNVKSVSTGAAAVGVTAGLTTSLGSFNAANPVTVLSLTTDANGNATASLYPGTVTGTATLLAQVDTSINQLNLPVQQLTVFLSSIEPNRGVAEGGQTVMMHGGGFVTPVRVTFGGVVSPKATVKSSTLIQAQVPRSPQPVDANSTLTVDVVLTSAINQPNPASDTLAQGFTYTSGTDPIDRPVIFALSPNNGPNEGQTPVAIIGSFLPKTVAEAQVTFGFASGDQVDGLDATVTAAASAGNRLDVLTPRASGLGGSLQNHQVDVLVRNRTTGFFTISHAIYRYGNTTDDLFIGDVQPRSAPIAGGTPVTIVGRNFPAQMTVLLAGQPAAIATPAQSCTTSGGPTCVVVTSPAVTASGCSAPSGPVTVTNTATGQSATSTAVFSFTVARPQLTGVTANVGPAAGNTPVTISGSGFVAGSTPRVLFNNAPATNVTVPSTTSITANTPAFTGAFDTESCTTSDSAAGTRFKRKAVDLTVTDLASGCGDTLAGAFTYVPADESCRANSLAPVANFSYDTVTGQPLSIRFINQSSGGKGTSFSWTFGDGFTSSQETPTHTYAVAGSYLVSFTVSNAAGTSSISKQITVPVPFSPATAGKRRRSHS
jgi:hypothetical protein